MSVTDIERLRTFTGELIRIVATDGERLTVKLLLMQDKYQDFICDIVETNRGNKYKPPLLSRAYTISYTDVASFELAETALSARS